MALLICSVISAMAVVMGVFLLMGRGSWLIAGYNTMSVAEKAKYDERALCKFIGKILIAIGALTPAIAVEAVSGWYPYAYGFLVTGLCAFAVIYANTGNRFRK